MQTSAQVLPILAAYLGSRHRLAAGTDDTHAIHHEAMHDDVDDVAVHDSYHMMRQHYDEEHDDGHDEVAAVVP